MANIQTFSPKTRLRSNEILTFGRALETKLLESDFADSPSIEKQFTVFKETLQAMDDSMISGGKSPLTPEMTAADKHRDQMQTGTIGQVRIFTNHFDPAKKTHAVHLMAMADKYKNTTQKSYEEQTSVTTNFIQEAESDAYKADVEALGLAEWLAELKKANDECARLSARNIAEKGTRNTMPKLADTRPPFEEAYDNLAKRFNALAEVNGDTDYQELFAWWNALIDRYRLLLSNRLGTGKGGSPDNGASNRPDENTGGGGGDDDERPGEL